MSSAQCRMKINKATTRSGRGGFGRRGRGRAARLTFDDVCRVLTVVDGVEHDVGVVAVRSDSRTQTNRSRNASSVVANDWAAATLALLHRRVAWNSGSTS